MLFSSIIGQEDLQKQLILMIQQGRLPHAVSLAGNSGSGTLAIALAMAQYLQCESPSNTDSCGVCTPCKQMLKLEHPDVHFTFPTVSSKAGAKNVSEAFITEFKEFALQTPYADIYDWYHFISVENQQGNITAEECRNLIEKMRLKSYQGKYKVAIVWRPEYLGKEGNMLLKFIEEPAPNTILLFITEQDDKLLSTIRSRLQRIPVKPIPSHTLAQALATRHGKKDEDAQKIALMAKGDYAQALKIMNHWDDDMISLVTQWLNATYTNNNVLIYEWVEQVSKMGRESIKNLLEYIQELFTHALRLTYAPGIPLYLPEADGNIVKKLSKMNLSMDIYEQINKDLADKSYNIERNAHIKIQLQHLCIQMQFWLKGATLTKLHDTAL